MRYGGWPGRGGGVTAEMREDWAGGWRVGLVGTGSKHLGAFDLPRCDDQVPAEDSLLDEPAKGLAEGEPVGGDREIEGGHGEGGADAGESALKAAPWRRRSSGELARGDRSAGIRRRCGRRCRSRHTRTGARGIHR